MSSTNMFFPYKLYGNVLDVYKSTQKTVKKQQKFR